MAHQIIGLSDCLSFHEQNVISFRNKMSDILVGADYDDNLYTIHSVLEAYVKRALEDVEVMRQAALAYDAGFQELDGGFEL